MIASLALEGSQLPQSVLAIPLSAVVRNPGSANGFAVLIAEGGGETETARLRAIELGEIYGNMIAAKSGLNPGESVITTGAGIVKNGDRVRIIP
jgi:multidrug efflux pump subunit AcrA (membrane-fusion protein)